MLQKVFDKFCPITKTDCSREIYNHKPRITDDIRSQITEKKLQNKYLRKPITYGRQYRALRNKINILKKVSEELFW